MAFRDRFLPNRGYNQGDTSFDDNGLFEAISKIGRSNDTPQSDPTNWRKIAGNLSGISISIDRLDKTPLPTIESVTFTADELNNYLWLSFTLSPNVTAGTIPIYMDTATLKAKSFLNIRVAGMPRMSWIHTSRTLSKGNATDGLDFYDVSLLRLTLR